jgi:hypothetical protein
MLVRINLGTAMCPPEVRRLAAKWIAKCCCSVLLLLPQGAGATYRQYAVKEPFEYHNERLVGLLSVVVLTGLAWLYRGYYLPNNRSINIAFTILVAAVVLTGLLLLFLLPD